MLLFNLSIPKYLLHIINVTHDTINPTKYVCIGPLCGKQLGIIANNVINTTPLISPTKYIKPANIRHIIVTKIDDFDFISISGYKAPITDKIQPTTIRGGDM